MQALASLFPEAQAHYEYISARPDTPRSIIRSLQQDLEKKKAKLLQDQELVSRLDQDNAFLEQQRENLLACIRDVKQHVDTVTQDLDISRSFAPDEGTMNEEAVITEFRKLGRLTNDVVSHVIHLFPSDVLNSKLTRQGSTLQGAALFLDLVVHRHPETRMELIMTYAIHYIIRSRMMDSVFQRLVPGIPSEENELLKEIHQSVSTHETQEKTARWRAMTYWHLRPELSRYESAVGRVMDDISKLLDDLIEPRITSDILMGYSGQKMRELFQFAANLQTKIQTACTSVNIEMFMPTGPVFDSDCMTPYDGAKGTTPTRFVMPIGLGLEKSWAVQERDGTVNVRRSYLQKASVICDNWQP